MLTGECLLLSPPFQFYLSFSQHQLALRDPPPTTVMEEMEKSAGFRKQEGGKVKQSPAAKSWCQSEMVCTCGKSGDIPEGHAEHQSPRDTDLLVLREYLGPCMSLCSQN